MSIRLTANSLLNILIYPAPQQKLTNTATEPLEEDHNNVLCEINAARLLRLDEEFKQTEQGPIKDGVTTEDAAEEESDEFE